MFERYLTSYLTGLLGEFVEPSSFSKDKLNLSAWSGSIVLENLQLKVTAFDVLDLPLTLRRGPSVHSASILGAHLAGRAAL